LSLLTHTIIPFPNAQSTTMAALFTYSAFTSLPEELKVHVLRLVLVLSSPIRTPIDLELDVDYITHTLLPVLLVSKERHRLGLEIFYGENTSALQPWRKWNFDNGMFSPTYQSLKSPNPAIGECVSNVQVPLCMYGHLRENLAEDMKRRGLTLNALLCRKGGDKIATTRLQKYYPALKSVTVVLYSTLDHVEDGTVEQDMNMKFLSGYCIVAKARKVVVRFENMSKTRLVISEVAKRQRDRWVRDISRILEDMVEKE
jgi:hypothetical protein